MIHAINITMSVCYSLLVIVINVFFIVENVMMLFLY